MYALYLVMAGNGLRPQIWTYRFKIPKVAEFYEATEGNSNIGVNQCGCNFLFARNKKT